MILYSTDCPRCKVLKKKLDEKEIKYEINHDIAIMQEKGIMSVPVLEIADENNSTKLLTFVEAVEYVNSL